MYNGSHFYFTYYHVELQSALPSAGPAIPANTRYDNPTTAAAANSTITLFGIGFDSLLTGQMITHKQVGEAKCRFGLAVTDVVAIGTTFSTTYPVPSPSDVGERRTTVQCVAPPMSLLHYMARPIGEVEVTLALNGVHFNSARPPVIYRYYDQRVTYIHPTGGPIGGGTMVTLQGYGLDALSDGGSSLRCRFGSVRVRVELQIVPSRKHDGGGGAGGRFEVRCRAPPRHPYVAGPSTFSLTLNAHHYLPSPSTNFLYYDDPHVLGVSPTGGPVAGGTIVTVLGHGFHGLNRNTHVAICKFGELGEMGRVISISEDGRQMTCRWEESSSSNQPSLSSPSHTPPPSLTPLPLPSLPLTRAQVTNHTQRSSAASCLHHHQCRRCRRHKPLHYTHPDYRHSLHCCRPRLLSPSTPTQLTTRQSCPRTSPTLQISLFRTSPLYTRRATQATLQALHSIRGLKGCFMTTRDASEPCRLSASLSTAKSSPTLTDHTTSSGLNRPSHHRLHSHHSTRQTGPSTSLSSPSRPHQPSLHQVPTPFPTSHPPHHTPPTTPPPHPLHPPPTTHPQPASPYWNQEHHTEWLIFGNIPPPTTTAAVALTPPPVSHPHARRAGSSTITESR